ncbi:LysR family transcriptional regulator [Pectobacterium jejuense]|uniref:LysR family transcriptional regulator n=1 Tax=Pectobacterium jejuense TaxID=2974022 RepID=UPI002282CC97|nr:LysR family transcriptional regulator [Pectobacterium jejuense]MCY9849336.1 LysR family transcriptional regulator [Pectobacterium jejuense]
MNFHGIDLNLLVAFDALMSERNVTRAAIQVGVSQPAMSSALSRLRKRFGDPLFLRSADGLLPTARARELSVPITQALRQIESTLVQRTIFEPGNTSLNVNLGLSDYPTFVLLPTLIQVLAKHAPGVSLNVHAFNDRDHAVDLLDAGVIDVAMGVPPTHADGRILTRPLFRDEFVTIITRNHPAAERGMTMEEYLALPHILASPEGELYGVVDKALAQQGKKRKLALTLPQMFIVPTIVAQTLMTATVLKQVALHSPVGSQLTLFPPPISLPDVVFSLIWHRRNDSHPAQTWLREFIAEHVAKE